MASSFSLTSQSSEGRYLSLSCTQTRNIASNTSTIKWTLTSTGGAYNYYSTGPTTVTINGTQVYYKGRTAWDSYEFPAAKGSTSGTITVSHNNTGDKSITVSLATAVEVYAVTTKSGTWTLDSIPRQATLTSAPNFNDENNPTISYSNPAGSAVSSLQACISLDGSKADIPYRNISTSGTSYTFNLTETERDILRKACTTSNSRTVYFYVRTIIGSTTFYSNLAKTLSIVNGNPTFLSDKLDYFDDDPVVATITKDPHMIVQNKSKLVIKYPAATAKKSATISKYTFTLNGVTKTSTSAGGTVKFGKINSDKDLTLSVTVTDSRGNTASATKTIKCYKYYTPYFKNFKAYRTNKDGNIDANGTWIKCEYTTDIASVDGTNARTISILGVGSQSISASGNYHMIDLKGDKDSTYKIYAIVQDLFGGSDSSIVETIYGGSRIINVHPSGTGIAFGKKSEDEELFECKWDASFLGDLSVKGKSLVDLVYPVGSIYMSVNSTSPTTLFGGSWTQLQDRFLIGASSTYSNGTTGGATTVTLTKEQMPSHTHKFTGSSSTTSSDTHSHTVPNTRGDSSGSGTKAESWADATASGRTLTTSEDTHYHTVTAAGTNENTGGGQAHNNMPPYLAVYMWERTA